MDIVTGNNNRISTKSHEKMLANMPVIGEAMDYHTMVFVDIHYASVHEEWLQRLRTNEGVYPIELLLDHLAKYPKHLATIRSPPMTDRVTKQYAYRPTTVLDTQPPTLTVNSLFGARDTTRRRTRRLLDKSNAGPARTPANNDNQKMYKRIAHLHDKLSRPFVQPSTPLPETLVDDLRTYVKEGKIQADQLDTRHVGDFMNKWRDGMYNTHRDYMGYVLTLYYDNDVFSVPVDVTDKLVDLARQLFVLYEEQNAMVRRKFWSYEYTIGLLLKVLGRDDLGRYFAGIRTRERNQVYMMAFTQYFTVLGWVRVEHDQATDRVQYITLLTEPPSEIRI